MGPPQCTSSYGLAPRNVWTCRFALSVGTRPQPGGDGGGENLEGSRTRRQKSLLPELSVNTAMDSASLRPGRSWPPQIALVAPLPQQWPACRIHPRVGGSVCGHLVSGAMAGRCHRAVCAERIGYYTTGIMSIGHIGVQHQEGGRGRATRRERGMEAEEWGGRGHEGGHEGGQVMSEVMRGVMRGVTRGERTVITTSGWMNIPVLRGVSGTRCQRPA